MNRGAFLRAAAALIAAPRLLERLAVPAQAAPAGVPVSVSIDGGPFEVRRLARVPVARGWAAARVDPKLALRSTGPDKDGQPLVLVMDDLAALSPSDGKWHTVVARWGEDDGTSMQASAWLRQGHVENAPVWIDEPRVLWLAGGTGTLTDADVSRLNP